MAVRQVRAVWPGWNTRVWADWSISSLLATKPLMTIVTTSAEGAESTTWRST